MPVAGLGEGAPSRYDTHCQRRHRVPGVMMPVRLSGRRRQPHYLPASGAARRMARKPRRPGAANCSPTKAPTMRPPRSSPRIDRRYPQDPATAAPRAPRAMVPEHDAVPADIRRSGFEDFVGGRGAGGSRRAQRPVPMGVWSGRSGRPRCQARRACPAGGSGAREAVPGTDWPDEPAQRFLDLDQAPHGRHVHERRPDLAEARMARPRGGRTAWRRR